MPPSQAHARVSSAIAKQHTPGVISLAEQAEAVQRFFATLQQPRTLVLADRVLCTVYPSTPPSGETLAAPMLTLSHDPADPLLRFFLGIAGHPHTIRQADGRISHQVVPAGDFAPPAVQQAGSPIAGGWHGLQLPGCFRP